MQHKHKFVLDRCRCLSGNTAGDHFIIVNWCRDAIEKSHNAYRAILEASSQTRWDKNTVQLFLMKQAEVVALYQMSLEYISIFTAKPDISEKFQNTANEIMKIVLETRQYFHASLTAV